MAPAAGISQPGGAGTDIFVYDDTHADAGGKGYYTMADILAKGYAAADFTNLGTTPDSYLSAVNIWFSDNTGSASVATTWTETKSRIAFSAAGKGVRTPTTASVAALVTFNLGTKITAASRSATRDGVEVYQRVSTTWRGNFYFYGSRLSTDTTNFLIIPYTTSTGSEMMATKMFAAGIVAPGSTAGDFAVIYNCEFVGGSTVSPLNNFAAADAEDIVIGTTATPDYFFSTGSNISAKGLVFLGSPDTGELRNTGGTWTFVNPKFSDAVARVALNSGTINEYWTADILVVGAAGTPISGASVKLWNVSGTLIIDTTTTSDGLVSYGSGLTANAIKVTLLNAGSETAQYPYILQVNGQKPIKFNHPYVQGTYGRNYLHLSLVYNLTTGALNFNGAPEIIHN